MKDVQTYRNWTLLAARIALAATIFPHGAQKVLGWFGGYGFSGTMEAFTTKMHIPAPLALAAIAAEFLGAFGILFGLLTRISAAGIGVTMLVAGAMNLHNGYFMNWFGIQKGEGVEYFIPVLALSLMLLIEGAGAFSLEGLLKRSPRVRSRPVTA
ncbi:MAG TPA: DoxX family protein [Fimbriimonadaceae bacterium]|nr:DoxX family protein [Fimbriimonadaceae bacterium]